MTTLAAPSQTSFSGAALLARSLRRREWWVAVLIAATVTLVAIVRPDFVSPQNFRDILYNAAPAAIVACGMTLVIVAAEIDISVGSMLSFMGAIMGVVSSQSHLNWGAAAGVAAALLVGAGIGLFNGLLITVGRVPSIIVTLGMYTVLAGATQVVMEGRSIRGLPPALQWFGTARPAGIPLAVWVALGVILLSMILAHLTPLGRRVYAVGSNPKAAPLAGLSTTRLKLFVFFLTGLLTGVAAIVFVPRSPIIETSIGSGFELLVITCVVVGGTSISGGKGTIFGSILAVLLITMIRTVLIYVNVDPHWNLAVQGGFILAAVLADHVVGRRQGDEEPA